MPLLSIKLNAPSIPKIYRLRTDAGRVSLISQFFFRFPTLAPAEINAENFSELGEKR